jgi:hypothetical protein
MENLFIEKPEFEKKADIRLSEDSAQWVKEILTYFQESFPELEKMPIRISFTQKDETRGYGTGALYIGDANITVPIIIDEFILNDLDVAIINKIVVPLTSDSVNVLFNSKNAFSQVVPTEDTNNTIKLFSRRLHTPDNLDKHASLKVLGAGISKEKLDNFLEKVAQYKSHFEENGTWNVVENFKNIECDSEKITNKHIENILPRDIYTIEKTGKYEYTAFLGNSEVDSKVSVKLKEEEVANAHNMLEKSASVKEYKEFSLSSSISSEAPIVDFDGSETNLDIIADTNGNFNIKKASVITRITPKGNFVLANKTKMPSTSTKVALKDKPDITKTAEKEDFGTFLTEKGATKPIFIEKIAKVNGKVEIEGFDGLNIVKLSMWKGIKEPAFDEEKNTYFWPIDTEFIKLGRLKENFSEFPEKLSSGDWIMKVDPDFYAFGGPNFEKYGELGHKLNDVDHPNAKWYMVQLGVSPSELEKLALKKEEKYYFSSDLHCPESLDQYSKKLTEKIGEALQTFDDAELDLIKEASTMEDGITVDALLSLKFLNKENLTHFIESIPLFEEISSKLAQLLLSVRLGLSVIPEMAVKKAMENLVVVTTKLYELGVLLKNNKK